jgi:hypothetical protein
MTRPRPCLACTIDKARSEKAHHQMKKNVPRSAANDAVGPSPCGAASCELRTDPVSLFMRWLRPPPPPRDPAAVLREYTALMASAAGGGAARGASAAGAGTAPGGGAAAGTEQPSK